MFTQLHSRNFPIALRQCSKSSCFGVSCNRPSTRRRQQVMTRADAAHDGRDSIAFTGSAGEHTTPQTEVVQGVEPAPRPVSQQPPSVWAAGIALGLGLACAVAWRQLSGHNSKKKAERQQGAVPTSLRTAPAGGKASRSTYQDNTFKPDISNSLSATRTAPAVNRSPPQEADVRTVRDQSAGQRRPAADATRPAAASAPPRKLAEQATEKPTQQMTQNLAEKPAEKLSQKPAQKPAERPSSQAPPPLNSGPAQTEAKPSQRGLSSNKLPSNSAAAAAAAKLADSPPAQPAPSSAVSAAAPPSKQREAKPSPSGLSDKAKQADAAAEPPRKQGIPSSSGPAIAAESSASVQPSSKQNEAKSSPTGLSGKAKQADAAADTPRKQGIPSSSGPAIAAESTGSVPPSSKQSEAKSSPIDKPKQADAAAGAPTKKDPPSSSQAATAAKPSPKQTDTKPSKDKLSGAAPAMAPIAAVKQQEGEPKPKGMPSPQGTSTPASPKSDTASDSADSTTAEPVRGSATAAPASSKAVAGSEPRSADKLSTAPDAAQQEKQGEGKAADQDGDTEGGESLHDLIAASSRDEEEIPEAFKTFDGNLPDDPEPDSSQQGPKLFQSAPKTDATLPPSQSPSSQSPTRGSTPKQAAPAGQDLEARPLTPASEEEAAQLRQRMQQLRQAMASQEADMALAQEEASVQPAQQQQQQQQADKQSSEFRQQQEEVAEAAQQEGDKQQAKMSEKEQQGEKAGQGQKAAADAKPRVLARPSSGGDSATIFLEKPGAGEGLRPSPAGDEGEQSIDLVAVAAGVVLPHPDKTDTGGEDAFFVSSHGRGAFGVADGVGGWNLEGVDPSRYSRLLMEHAEKAVLRGKGDREDGARDVVGFAHHSITRQSEEEGEDILGSSTICLGVMRPGGVVEIANVGDSGFRVLRGSEIVFASEAQQHSFNMPYQLAVPGPDQYSDTSESAVVYELELLPGDVIIVATDGVLDNLWDSQMAPLVHQFLGAEPRSVASAQACARMLVKIARYNSLDPNIRSPWAVESARMGDVPWWKRLRPAGGKVDDCTAVVVCLEPAGAVWDSDRQAVVSGGQAAVAVV